MRERRLSEVWTTDIEPQSVVGFLNAEEHSGRGEFNFTEGRGRQGGTVVERYQGGVAHRSAEAAASW
jgi:hypothetical protein